MKWNDVDSEQIERLVAEKVFKREVVEWSQSTLRNGVVDPIPNYTKDMSAAWQIAERFDEIIISKHIPRKYHCELWRGTTWYIGIAKTAQEAICLAALKAHKVDIE